MIACTDQVDRSTETSPSVALIGLIQAKRSFDNGSAVFLDVRASNAFQDSHIPGAISLPLDQIEFRLAELNDVQRIIIYCDCVNETDSVSAYRLLGDYGVDKVEVLIGGFNAWITSGFPVEP